MNRRFRSPNAGQTSLALQHSTSPRSGYKPALGANRDGYPMGGIPVQGFRAGGRIGFKKGTDKNWIQDVSKSIKKRGTKGMGAIIKSVKPKLTKGESTKVWGQKLRGKFKKTSAEIEENLNKILTQTKQLLQEVKGEKITKSGISKGKDIK